MGRRAKFKEDLMLKAVIKYSEIVKTEIKASELAKWAQINIEGLEEVRGYHFTRPIKNPITGKMEKRLCTKRIEELNATRNLRHRVDTNVILSSVNMDYFFELDTQRQREAMKEARVIVSEYKSTNYYLRQQNDYLKSIENMINEKIEECEEKIKEIRKKQSKLNNEVSYICNSVEEKLLREKLEEMGITDGDFDLIKYNESLKEDLSQVFNIEKAIKQYQQNMNIPSDEELEDNDEPERQEETKVSLDDLLDF